MNEQPTSRSEFEEALREGFADQKVRIGDVIEGMIAAIHGDVALVDISGKSEAVLARDELDDLGTGDPVEVVVVELGDEIRVSRQLAIEHRLKEKLAEAVASGEPQVGKVVDMLLKRLGRNYLYNACIARGRDENEKREKEREGKFRFLHFMHPLFRFFLLYTGHPVPCLR